MNLITERVPYYSRSDEFRWWHLTDLHVGARGCDERLLKRHIKLILDDPFAIVTLGGDLIDAINRKGDKRHLESTLAPWLWGKDDVLQAQLDYLRDEFLTAELCKKVIAVVSGNHEGAPDQFQGAGLYRQIVKHVAQHKDVPGPSIALGYRGFVNLSFRRFASTGNGGSGWNMHLFITHGYGGGKLAGGHALELERMLGRYEADVVVMGHRHTEAYVPLVSSRILGNRIVQTKRIGLLMAGYLGGGAEQLPGEMPLMSYDALHGYYPTTRGCTPILIDPNERDFLPVFSGGSGVMKRVPRMGLPPVEEMTPPPDPPLKRHRTPVDLPAMALVPSTKPKKERKARAA
jgi:predicted phosphodiesterase